MIPICVIGTVAASLILWAASELARGPRRRLLWTLSVCFLTVHSIAAFATIYDWSHQTALAATARQTRDAIGVDAGIGIYVNYVFLVAWSADAIWWWRSPEHYSARPAWLSWVVRGFVWFMFLNGAVIFADGWMRVLGAAAVATVFVSWVRHR